MAIEEVDEEDKIEIKQVDLLQSVFDKLCRNEHPPMVIVNGEEKFEVVNVIMDGAKIISIALDDKKKHLDNGVVIKVNEVDQQIVEMIVDSHKLGMAWLKKVNAEKVEHLENQNKSEALTKEKEK